MNQDITLKQLRAFVAVAQQRSFADACGQLHLSQPALSITIKNLEEAVGGQLLARSTRSLSLTPEGEQFLPVAKRLLTDWREAVDDLQSAFALKRGKLAIASMPSYAATHLPRVLARFRDLYPNIKLTVHDIIAEDVVDMVRSGRIEMGISFEPPTGEDLDFSTLFTDRFVAALPPAHPLLRKRHLRWQTLTEEPFIALQYPSSIRQLMDQSLAAENLFLQIEFETNQLATIGRMVASGLGVSAVPALCSEQMQELGVTCRPLVSPAVSRRVGILTRPRHPLSQGAQAMVEILGDYYL